MSECEMNIKEIRMVLPITFIQIQVHYVLFCLKFFQQCRTLKFFSPKFDPWSFRDKED